MDRSEAFARFSGARVARLATTRPDGTPHLVPITFAMTDDGVVTMIDHKPKTTTRLQRLVNLEADPRAAILVDDYDEDWGRLWWVRLDGTAEIHQDDGPWHASRRALAEKYPQYRQGLPTGPAIVVRVERVTSWQSTP